MADEKYATEKDASALERNPTIGDGETATYLKHIDRNDADEAMKAFAGGDSILMTPEMERKLLRKIDLNLMPVRLPSIHLQSN
jgi:ACS family allantoate permease-like MFS transporter